MRILGRKQLLMGVLAVELIFLSGVVGYIVIEGWSLSEAIYMTVITLTTVGYGEVRPLTFQGKIFTVFLISFGVVAIASVIAAGSKIILEGQLNKIMGRRKLEKEIKKLKNHYIISGYGRMGRIICEELRKKKIPFVVIEHKQEVVADMDEDLLSISGDATQDAVLLSAGIKQAKGLVSVVSSDADNVYITLTARGLSANIYIVARAGEEGSEKKLLRAGADRVVSPYVIGGGRIANAILRPAVVDFLDLVTQSEHLDLQMEEVSIHQGSGLGDVTILESAIRQHLNIIIIAIKKSSGHMVFNPSSASIIEVGDRLIVLGDSENLVRLVEVARGEKSFRHHPNADFYPGP